MAVLAFATGGINTVTGTPPSDLSLAADSRAAGDALEMLGVDSNTLNTYKMEFDTITGSWWLSFYVYADASSWATQSIVEVRDGLDVIVRLRGNGFEETDVRWYDGASEVAVSTDIGLSPNTLYRVDIEYLNQVSGAIRVYLNNSLASEYLGDLTANTREPDNVMFNSPGPSTGASNATYFSSMFIADEDTRPITMVANTTTGDGADTDMTGSYTDIDDLGPLEDTLKLISTSVNQVNTFTKSALPAPYTTGYDIVGLGVYARTAVASGGVSANMEFVQDDGTNTVTSGDIAVDETLSPRSHIFTTAPDGGAWDVTKLDGAEFGVKSKA